MKFDVMSDEIVENKFAIYVVYIIYDCNKWRGALTLKTLKVGRSNITNL